MCAGNPRLTSERRPTGVLTYAAWKETNPMSNRFPMNATGRVATDPELSTGQNGAARVRFRLAVHDRVQQPDGQWADGQTVFHDVVAFSESAKTYADTFRKGDAVAVMGDL